jgi:hypothetical protein
MFSGGGGKCLQPLSDERVRENASRHGGLAGTSLHAARP